VAALAEAGSAAAATPRPLLLARAQAVLVATRAGGGDEAALRAQAEALQTWVAERKDDGVAWQLLGQLHERLGFKLRALRAQAEVQAASGDLPGAIDRLRAAQRQARGPATAGVAPDFIEASIIDARLRDLMAKRRAQIAELRGERDGERQP
jgi:predicted Zn-dependent protease